MAQNLLTLSAGGIVTEVATAYAPLAAPAFTGNLTADSPTLAIDSTNHRVGIGAATPATKLEVVFSGNTGVRLSNTGNGAGDYSVLDFYQNNAQIALLYTHSNNFVISTTGTMTLSATSFSFGASAVTMGALTATSTKVVPVAVASLPAGAAGMRAFVNNALAPAFGAAVAAGGAVTVPVYHDGTSWKVG